MPGPGERTAACPRVSSAAADLPPGCWMALTSADVRSREELSELGLVVLLSGLAVPLCRGKALGDVVPIWGCLG